MNVNIPIQQDFPADRTVFYKWSQVMGYLEARFGKVSIAAWADDAIVKEFNEHILIIETGSDFKCEVMKRRCLNHIQNALKELYDTEAMVEIYASEDCGSIKATHDSCA